MPVNLSIKNTPDEIAERLSVRERTTDRCKANCWRFEEPVRQPAMLTAREVLAEVRRLGHRTPAEAVAFIRAHRDGR